LSEPEQIWVWEIWRTIWSDTSIWKHEQRRRGNSRQIGWSYLKSSISNGCKPNSQWKNRRAM